MGTQHRRVRGHRAPVLGAIALVATALVLAGAPPAAAHTELVTSAPEDGTTLRSWPSQAVLTFSDEMDPTLSAFTLQIEDGRSESLKVRAGGLPTELIAEFPSQAESTPGDGKGTWRLNYRVVSADGHPVSGALRFVVSVPPRKPHADAGNPAPNAQPRAQSDEDGAPPQSHGSDQPWWRYILIAAFIAVVALVAVFAMRRITRDDLAGAIERDEVSRQQDADGVGPSSTLFDDRS